MFKESLQKAKENYKKFKQKIVFLLNKIKLPRYKKILILLLSLIICFIIFVGICSRNISKEECLKKFQISLEDKKKNINDYLYIKDEKVSSNSLLPVIEYYQNNEEGKNILLSDLTKKNKSGKFEVKMKKGLFTKKYYVNLDTIEVKFKFADSNAEMTIENYGEIKENKKYIFIPGRYTAKTTMDSKYGKIVNEKTLDIFKSGMVDIDIGGEYITIYSNFKDAEVYINGIKSGLKASEIKEYGPIPNDESAKVYLQKSFPWGTIKSKEVNITKYINLNIDMVNEKLVSDINKLLNDFYSSLFSALNKEDKSLIVNATEDVKDKIYEDINEKIIFFTNNYKISDLKIQIEKSEFSIENGEYVGTIVSNIDYKIYKKLLPFLKEDKEDTFLLNIKYENDQWVLVGGEKITASVEE